MPYPADTDVRLTKPKQTKSTVNHRHHRGRRRSGYCTTLTIVSVLPSFELTPPTATSVEEGIDQEIRGRLTTYIQETQTRHYYPPTGLATCAKAENRQSERHKTPTTTPLPPQYVEGVQSQIGTTAYPWLSGENKQAQKSRFWG